MYRSIRFTFSLIVLLAVSALPLSAHDLSGAQEVAAKIVGAASFVNIIWVFSIGLAAVCILALLKEWLWFLITLLPAHVYEVIAYIVSVGFIIDAFAKEITGPENAPFVALTGCVFVGMSILFSCFIHGVTMKPKKYFGILLPVFGTVAVLLESPMIGFGAIVCLMAAMGFSIWIGTLCYGFGFEEEDALIRASLVGLFLVILVALSRIVSNAAGIGVTLTPPFLRIFELGALWMGSFVGYLGLLIASFTYYRRSRRIPTVVAKLLMVIFCLGGMFVGSLWNIGVLKTMATVYFALFLLELPAEVRPESVTAWACTGLLVAAIGWGGSLWVKSHMDIVGYWLTF